MDTLLLVHSFVRWIIILVAVIVIVKFVIAWAANSLFKAMDRGLASALQRFDGFTSLARLDLSQSGTASRSGLSSLSHCARGHDDHRRRGGTFAIAIQKSKR